MKSIIFKVNKISNKLLIFLVLTSLLPLIGAVTALKINMERQLINYRKDELNHEIKHFENELLKYKNYMKLIANDYSNWDDAFTNVKNKNIEWLHDNIINWLPENFEFTYTAIYDEAGLLIGESSGDFFISDINSNNIYGKVDFISLKDSLYLATISDILPNSGQYPSSGTLIILKEIDESFIKDTISVLETDTTVVFNNASLVDQYSLDTSSLTTLFENDQLIIKNKLYTYFPILNSMKETIAYGIVGISADFYTKALKTIYDIQFFIYIISLGFFVIAFYLFRTYILLPLKFLKETIRKISIEKKPIPIEIKRKDEIGELVEAFNDLAVEIDSYSNSLKTLSITDETTSLYNFRYFNSILDEKINDKAAFSLAFLEIDFLLSYTNIFPRSKAESLIWELASLLRKSLDQQQLAFRIDHSTFAIITNIYLKDSLIATIESLQRDIAELSFEGRELLPTELVHVTAGIVDYPDEAVTKETLVKLVDNKLHNARHYLNNRIGDYYSIYHDVSLIYENATLKEVFPLTKTLLSVLQVMDQYTLCHSEGVAKYSVAIGKRMGLAKEDMNILQYGALLHDIGKIELGGSLLNKTGVLTDEEFKLIKEHPTFGVNIVLALKPLHPIIPIIKYHHEWYNGAGYPKALRGNEIPLMARIVAVADAYDSMITNRPYRTRAKTHDEAIQELLRCSNAQFDPDIVRLFIDSFNTKDF